MTMLATWSSTAVPRKMIRSFSRREKMSQPRSPRWVCSMTVGIMKLDVTGGGRSNICPECSRLESLIGSSFSCCWSGSCSPSLVPGLFGRHNQTGRILVGDLSLRDQHIKRLLFDELRAQRGELTLGLELRAKLLGIFLPARGELGDPLL